MIKRYRFIVLPWFENGGRLKGDQKSPDDLLFQGPAALGDHFRGHMVNPRQPRPGAAGDERQLSIIFLRETLVEWAYRPNMYHKQLFLRETRSIRRSRPLGFSMRHSRVAFRVSQ